MILLTDETRGQMTEKTAETTGRQQGERQD